MKWGDHKTLKFIRLYEAQPCLWDISSPFYSNRKKREEALNAILAELNIADFTQADCKAKIKNIRSQYCYELKKIRLSLKKGGKVYKPTLTWFRAVDRFLRRVVVQRTQSLIKDELPLLGPTIPGEHASTDTPDVEFVDYTTDVTDDTSEEGTTVKKEDCLLDETEAENHYEGNSDPSASSSHNFVESTSHSFQTAYVPESEERRKVNETLNLLTTTVNKLETVMTRSVPAPTSSEFEVFGQSVAAQLTNMPIEDALQLQMEIQQLITTKRISRLSRTK